MAKILTFRTKEDEELDKAFLTNDAEKLSFCTAEDGAVSIGTVSSIVLPALPDPKKDWQNQELADLFRVRQLLSGANVPLDTARGITDEGDPWFVFCHLNGDVFIHIARIDGFYVLDSPSVQRPLRGNSFNTLVADFTNQALPSAQNEHKDTERRVIRLDRGGKVQLHPSAMLAALIWTLFLASEDLVMLAPEEQDPSADDLLNFEDIIAANLDLQTVPMETAGPVGLGMPETMKELHSEMLNGTLEAQVQMREAMSQQGLASQQNTYAMSLSTIAIALGFMSEAVLVDDQREVLDGLNIISAGAHALHTEINPELEKITGESGRELLEMLGEFLGVDIRRGTEVAEVTAEKSEASLLQQDVLHVTANTDVQSALLSVVKTTPTILRKSDNIELPEEAGLYGDIKLSDEGLVNIETLVVVDTNAQTTPLIMTVDLISTQHKMEEFQLGDVTVMANFDITGAGAPALTESIESIQSETSYNRLDDRAQAFIEYIQAKDTAIGIVETENQTIMIDQSAYTYQGDGVAYYLNWEDLHGKIISVIGLKSEFQAFDLIA